MKGGEHAPPASPPDLTGALARFALETRAADLPEEAVRAIRRALLDYAGVAAAGSAHPAFRAMLQTLPQGGGTGTCRLVGCSGQRSDAVNVTLANGLAAHVFDWDDTLLPARVHLSATLFPPLLAIGEKHGLHLKEIIAAFAVAFEIQARISRAIYPAIHQGRWHSTAVVAPPGAAAGVGRLLGLSPEQLVHAIGLAANTASGLMSSFGTMAKALNVGRAGAAGLHCAYLALHGMRAHVETMSAGGYLTAFDPAPRAASLLDGLGSRWAVLENGFKPYPCGFVAHAAIDTVRDLRRSAGQAELAQMVVLVAPEALQLMGNGAPRDALQAKFSLPYVLAIAWVLGAVTPAAFEVSALDDPAVRDAMRRIVVRAEPGRRQDSAAAEATFADGHNVSLETSHARGTPDRPLTDADLVEKFRAARRGAGLDDGVALAERILGNEDVATAELTSALAG